jgi:hypothetical protein
LRGGKLPGNCKARNVGKFATVSFQPRFESSLMGIFHVLIAKGTRFICGVFEKSESGLFVAVKKLLGAMLMVRFYYLVPPTNKQEIP